MKPIIEKVLASGLVEKAAIELLEQWKYLPVGSSEKVLENALKDATQERLSALARELAVEVEKEHKMRETYLDLEKLRWPVEIKSIRNPTSGAFIVGNLTAVRDRMGRYYFRAQDVKQEWLVPGYTMSREIASVDSNRLSDIAIEKILQVQMLYIGDAGVCIQVATDGN